MISRFLWWLVIDSSIPLGPFGPWVFGLALRRMPKDYAKWKP